MRARNWVLIASAVSITVFYALCHLDDFKIQIQHDFLCAYTGYSLAFSPGLYDPAVQSRRAQEILPNPQRQLIPFIRPAFYAWAMWPLAQLPYMAAYVAWLCLQYGMLAWTCFRAWHRFGPPSIIFCVVFWPVAVGIFAGQDSALVLVMVFEAFLAIEQHGYWRAGAICALTLFKFHLMLLVPLVILLRRNWRMLEGYVTVATALTIACLAWGHPKSYIALLRRDDIVNPSPGMMINIRGIALNFGAPWIVIPLILLVGAIVVYAARLSADWQWFGAAVAGSPLIVPHVYLYDLASLLVFLLAALTSAKSPLTRWTAFLIILPPIHAAIALGAPWAAIPPLAIIAFMLCLALDRKFASQTLPKVPHPHADSYRGERSHSRKAGRAGRGVISRVCARFKMAAAIAH